MTSQASIRRLVRIVATVALIAGAGAAPGAEPAGAAVESEPTLQYSDFGALPPATGTGYKVDAKVPVSGYLGQFTVHTDSGDLKADGTGLLKQRIYEVAATLELQKMSKSSVFADAVGKSIEDTGKSVGRAVAHPVDTVAGVPAGVGRLFTSIGKGVNSAVSSSGKGDTTGAAKEALGVNEAKRQLAKNVGVDPYTTNPQLSARLEELAEAAVAGGISLDVLTTLATAGVATAISATATVSNLAWDLPPEDIRERNDKDLTAMTVDEGTRKKLLDNRWFTPTMALSFVEALKGLGVRDGANALAALAATSTNEAEARFFITQLRMAQSYAKGGDAIVSLLVIDKTGAFRTASGALFIPAPVDYLSWTEVTKDFVDRKEIATGKRTVWFTGKTSPTAAANLRAKGWNVREQVAQD